MGFKDLLKGSILSSVGKSFSDTFNRADQTGLGGAWTIRRGGFNISGNKASATDTNYSLASVGMPYPNVNIEMSGISQGSMAALWVTDSGNWWAAGVDQQAVSCNCSYYNVINYNYSNNCTNGAFNNTSCNGYNNPCAGYSSPCNTWSNPCKTWSNPCNGGYNATFCVYSYYNTTNKRYTCVSYGGGNCKAWSSPCNAYSSPCNGYSNPCTGGYNSPCSGGWNPTSQIYFNCLRSSESGPYLSCNTCYPQYIRVIQSIGSSISTVASWTLSQIAQSLRIKTDSGTNQITLQAFSDTSLASQIDGTLTYTPTGVTVTTNFGMVVQPSQYQGTTIDEINITKN